MGVATEIIPPVKLTEVTVPVPGMPLICVSTNAVVANCVVLVLSAAVGANGTPVNVGLALNTTLPVPVLAVTPVPPLATARVPARVIAPTVAEDGVKPVVPVLKDDTYPVVPLDAAVMRP